MIVRTTTARQVPGGLYLGLGGPRRYQYPREKKPSSASTKITIRMIQRMLMRFTASLRVCRPAVDLLGGTTKNPC
jgi:hypothetical protein